MLMSVAAICAVILRVAAGAEGAHQHEVIAPAAALPGQSIYQLDAKLTTADGKVRSLDDLRGRPVLITMFYSSCQATCPMLAFSMRRMTAALSEAERQRLQPVMISFDPARDSPAALAEFGRLNKLEPSRWWLARAPDSTVREIAAVLGIRYREASPGVFSHSAVITLLDEEGRIVQRTSKLDALDPEFMQAVRSTLARAHAG